MLPILWLSFGVIRILEQVHFLGYVASFPDVSDQISDFVKFAKTRTAAVLTFLNY